MARQATRKTRPQACTRLKRLEREVADLRAIMEASGLAGATDKEPVQKPAEVDAFGEPIRRGADGKRIATAMDDAFLFPDEQIALNITHDDGKAVSQ